MTEPQSDADLIQEEFSLRQNVSAGHNATGGLLFNDDADLARYEAVKAEIASRGLEVSDTDPSAPDSP